MGEKSKKGIIGFIITILIVLIFAFRTILIAFYEALLKWVLGG